MKQFILFSYDAYYPSGGLDDFIMSFDSFNEANEYVMTGKNNLLEFCEILDIQTDVMWSYEYNEDDEDNKYQLTDQRTLTPNIQ